MTVPTDCRYTHDHEWLRERGNAPGVVTIGITAHAQEQLGDVVYVDLPKVGTPLRKGTPFGTVESVKAVSDLFAPVSGEVVSANDVLQHEPQLVNADPFAKGWMITVKLSDPAELKDLLSPQDYAKLLG